MVSDMRPGSLSSLRDNEAMRGRANCGEEEEGFKASASNAEVTAVGIGAAASAGAPSLDVACSVVFVSSFAFKLDRCTGTGDLPLSGVEEVSSLAGAVAMALSWPHLSPD